MHVEQEIHSNEGDLEDNVLLDKSRDDNGGVWMFKIHVCRWLIVKPANLQYEFINETMNTCNFLGQFLYV